MDQARRPLIEVEYAHNGDRLLALLRRQHPDYHPILNIAKIAHDAEVRGGPDGEPNLELALKAHTTVLRYIEPELKSVEVTVGNQNRRTINVSLFEDDEVGAAQQVEQRRNLAVSRIIDAELADEAPVEEPAESGA
jgi:hypothetical protein